MMQHRCSYFFAMDMASDRPQLKPMHGTVLDFLNVPSVLEFLLRMAPKAQFLECRALAAIQHAAIMKVSHQTSLDDLLEKISLPNLDYLEILLNGNTASPGIECLLEQLYVYFQYSRLGSHDGVAAVYHAFLGIAPPPKVMTAMKATWPLDRGVSGLWPFLAKGLHAFVGSKITSLCEDLTQSEKCWLTCYAFWRLRSSVWGGYLGLSSPDEKLKHRRRAANGLRDLIRQLHPPHGYLPSPNIWLRLHIVQLQQLLGFCRTSADSELQMAFECVTPLLLHSGSSLEPSLMLDLSMSSCDRSLRSLQCGISSACPPDVRARHLQDDSVLKELCLESPRQPSSIIRHRRWSIPLSEQRKAFTLPDHLGTGGRDRIGAHTLSILATRFDARFEALDGPEDKALRDVLQCFVPMSCLEPLLRDAYFYKVLTGTRHRRASLSQLHGESTNFSIYHSCHHESKEWARLQHTFDLIGGEPNPVARFASSPERGDVDDGVWKWYRTSLFDYNLRMRQGLAMAGDFYPSFSDCSKISRRLLILKVRCDFMERPASERAKIREACNRREEWAIDMMYEEDDGLLSFFRKYPEFIKGG